MGAEFHADGRTYMTKLMVTFHNVANAPKNTQKYNFAGCEARSRNSEERTHAEDARELGVGAGVWC